jgi:hypothetical protein
MQSIPTWSEGGPNLVRGELGMGMTDRGHALGRENGPDCIADMNLKNRIIGNPRPGLADELPPAQLRPHRKAG